MGNALYRKINELLEGIQAKTSTDRIHERQAHVSKPNNVPLPSEVRNEIEQFRNRHQVVGRLLFNIPSFARWVGVFKVGAVLRSQPLYVSGLEWRCLAVLDSEHLALFTQCFNPQGSVPWQCTARVKFILRKGEWGKPEWRKIAADVDFYSHAFHHLPDGQEWGIRQAVSFVQLIGCSKKGARKCSYDRRALQIEMVVTAGTAFFGTGHRVSLDHTVLDYAKFAEKQSTTVSERPKRLRALYPHVTLRILLENTHYHRGYLGLYLTTIKGTQGGRLEKELTAEELAKWDCYLTAVLRVVKTCGDTKATRNYDEDIWTSYVARLNRIDMADWGVARQVKHEYLLDPANGYVQADGSVQLRVDVFALDKSSYDRLKGDVHSAARNTSEGSMTLGSLQRIHESL